MASKKVKRDLWESFFTYPSFNIRFWVTFLVVFIIFGILTYFLLVVKNVFDKVAVLNLIIQGATLVLGIFAAYYALRQLVETRFTGLDEAGMQELKLSHYSRAFEKWREAFYIRPEAGVFTNMCESLLLIGDYDTFDHYMKISQPARFIKKEIFQETSDKMILLYLNVVRHLLVENLGEAKKYLGELVSMVKKEGLAGFNWDFLDLRRSLAYQNLSIEGEARKITDNLISYLSKNIPPLRKQDFEKGFFSSQAGESSQ